MATWKDKNGKEWNCEITIKTLKQIKQRLGIDLLEPQENIKKLIADKYLLCDVLYLAHEDACKQQNITDEDFGGLLVGDAIDGATKALIDSLICFFPTQQRQMLEKITKKREEVTAAIYQKIGNEIDNLPIEKVMEELQRLFGKESTNLQE